VLGTDHAGGEALQKEWAIRISKSKQVVRILGFEPLCVRNAITRFELSVKLVKVNATIGQPSDALCPSDLNPR
jgi:hypothetical protein